MSAAGRMQEIRKGAGQDNPDDLAIMVDIIADARRGRNPGYSGRQADDFALGILCFIFDPVKAEPYRQAIRALRRQYRGIAASPSLQDQFRESLTDELLDATSAPDAFALDVTDLFATMADGMPA